MQKSLKMLMCRGRALGNVFLDIHCKKGFNRTTLISFRRFSNLHFVLFLSTIFFSDAEFKPFYKNAHYISLLI